MNIQGHIIYETEAQIPIGLGFYTSNKAIPPALNHLFIRYSSTKF